MIPIPGTTSPAHVQENADSVNVRLDAATLAELDALINQQTVDGARYNAQSASEVDTEEFQA